MRQAFAEMARADALARREGLPDPRKLIERGIQTKESIDWQAALHPETPEPEPRMPDRLLRASALEAQRQEHRERINRLREEFRSRPAKARSDFGIARDYRGPEHER